MKDIYQRANETTDDIVAMLKQFDPKMSLLISGGVFVTVCQFTGLSRNRALSIFDDMYRDLEKQKLREENAKKSPVPFGTGEVSGGS